MRFAAFAVALLCSAETLPKDDGYRGIWYYNQPSKDKYVYKYSGGFATYPQQHAPIAIYSKETNKTFFCYGGTVKGKRELLHMVSYYDHETGVVPRPTILLNKKTEDAHDNPTISIDGDGYIWIFSSAHGTSRPSFLHRSSKPYSVESFDRILETNFSYTQPWHIAEKGFLFLHTRYRNNRRALFSMTSEDGRTWSDPREIAFALMGHYQISWPAGAMVGTAFDIHPPPTGLNARTNVYYMRTPDFGRTWQAADGTEVEIPVRTEKNAALVSDFRSQNLLVYLKDLNYDAEGRPVIVYLTSKGYESGPANGPRMLRVAQWTGTDWRHTNLAPTDHNYDHGSLYVESDGTWRFIGPTGPGPQPYGTGGEVEMWESHDRGATWKRTAQLTKNSRYNHTYVRRPLHAHQNFYAFWADGDGFAESPSALYFADKRGQVFRLPETMSSDFSRPVYVGR